jgi:hypothetical protein
MNTPAPWKQAPDAFYYITDQHGNALAHVIDSQMPEKETRANARLIAAAPELLAALEEITLAYQNARIRLHELDGAADETPLLQKARAAIAKATAA